MAILLYWSIIVDDYIIIWFENGLVTGMNSYKNSLTGIIMKKIHFQVKKPLKWEKVYR